MKYLVKYIKNDLTIDLFWIFRFKENFYLVIYANFFLIEMNKKMKYAHEICATKEKGCSKYPT